MRTYLEEDLNYLLDKDIKFRDYPLSFSRCCFALDLDPDVTRERILQQVWAASVRDDSRLPRRHKEAQHTKRERRAA
jgi:hypothetical protein